MKDTNMIYKLQQTKSGDLTCEVRTNDKSLFLHSSYDPIKEAEKFWQNHRCDLANKQKVIIYGVGCGYHIAALLKLAHDTQQIEVWDFNVDFFNFIKTIQPVKNIILGERVRFCITDDKNLIAKYFNAFNIETSSLIIHPPSLKIIPSTLDDLKNILESFQVNINSILTYKDKLADHFVENIKTAYLDRQRMLANLLEGVPMVLVAAGPSLAKSFVLLKNNRDKFVIGCVGTALASLIKHDIIPDFFMLTDPLDSLDSQFVGIDPSIQINVPLFYLSTVSPKVVSKYKGTKIMLLQEGFAQAEDMAKVLGMTLVKTGGSVATALLDWMIQLGAKQVCFVGQDLAYSNKESHIAGTTYHTQVSDSTLQQMLQVDDYFLQGKVHTPRNLYIYKKWIEDYIGKHPNVEFCNATQGGAHIYGCKHVDLSKFISESSFEGKVIDYQQKFRQIINQISKGQG